MEIQNGSIEDLHLDLKNFRTPEQSSQEDAVRALIEVGEVRFWGLFESLREDGYTPTEIIIVIQTAKGKVVKEGNRRIACMKLLHGLLTIDSLPIRRLKEIALMGSDWKDQNKTVPCLVYEEAELDIVNRLVSRTHARDEPAGRKEWPAIAKTRFDRDAKGNGSVALDLVEKWLSCGENLQDSEVLKWGGEFGITILDEVLPKLVSRLGYNSPSEMVEEYPDEKRTLVERLLRDIGSEVIGFKHIRDEEKFWAERFPIQNSPTVNSSSGSRGSEASSVSNSEPKEKTENPSTSQNQNTGIPPAKPSSDANFSAPSVSPRRTRKAIPANDPRTVVRKLKSLYVRDKNREKVASILLELKILKTDKHPLAFCFLLRSLFETSAKAYCQDHENEGLTMQKPDGSDKKMVTVLNEIIAHMENHIPDRSRKSALHGARTELTKPEGILSVKSMNELIHNPSFSTSGSDIATVFNNIFPLLEEMNA